LFHDAGLPLSRSGDDRKRDRPSPRYIVDATPEELQSAFDITLQRFAEYHNLQGAFGRRAVIEPAKGILMTRHSINSDRAFEMLRDHSQHNGRKLSDVAAVVESHLLLVPAPTPSERPD
jgi:response regulator NasT